MHRPRHRPAFENSWPRGSRERCSPHQRFLRLAFFVAVCRASCSSSSRRSWAWRSANISLASCMSRGRLQVPPAPLEHTLHKRRQVRLTRNRSLEHALHRRWHVITMRNRSLGHALHRRRQVGSTRDRSLEQVPQVSLARTRSSELVLQR